uniref:Germin-like protein n=1 Tax=Lactuca sativa TaxID=4236 RepID=A0A9R1WV05_LACSA|nr:hypothetical protein LSAT_V11C900496480 [Lactuca sativa]
MKLIKNKTTSVECILLLEIEQQNLNASQDNNDDDMMLVNNDVSFAFIWSLGDGLLPCVCFGATLVLFRTSVWQTKIAEVRIYFLFIFLGVVFLNGLVCKESRLVQPNDFFYRGLQLMGNTSNAVGSAVTPVTVAELPGLNTLGISMARIDFAPQGINPPHTHPRATEILTVMEGRILKGDVFIFLEGLIHFQKNIGNGYAVAIEALSSQNPGVITFANAVFGSHSDIAADILAKAFQVDINVVYQIQSKF